MQTQMQLHQDCLEPIVNKIKKKKCMKIIFQVEASYHCYYKNIFIYHCSMFSPDSAAAAAAAAAEFWSVPHPHPTKNLQTFQNTSCFYTPVPSPHHPLDFLRTFLRAHTVCIKLFLELPCRDRLKFYTRLHRICFVLT